MDVAPRRKKPLILAAKLSLTLLAFYAAFYNIDFTHIAETAQSQAIAPVLVASLFLGLQIVLGAARWQIIMAATAQVGDRVLRSMESLRLYYISAFFNACLVGAMGSDVVRVWMAKALHVPLPLAINSVIIDRLLALLALGVLVLATLPLLSGWMGFDTSNALLGSAALTCLGAWFLWQGPRLLASWQHIRPVGWLLYLVNCLRLLLKRPATSLVALLNAVCGHITYCMAAYALLQSLGHPLSVVQCIALVPPVVLAMTLPISIGGWGVREVGLVGMLGLAGVPQATALTMSIELGLLSVLISLPAALLWLGQRRAIER